MAKSAIYFTRSAVAASPGGVILSGHMIEQEDEPSFTRLAFVRADRSWGLVGDVRNDVVHGLASRPSATFPGLTDVCAIGRDGTLWMKLPRQDPAEVRVPVREPGMFLECICLASDGIYVGGGQRQLYRYADGQWSSQDDGIYVPSVDGRPGPTLFSVVEYDDRSLLAVGSGGYVAHRLRGASWATLDCPTNVDLLCALPDERGGVWIGGDKGTLLYLSADMATWADYSDTSVSEESLDCLALFRGHLHATAMNDLLMLEDGKLVAVEAPFKPDSEFHSVCASGDYLFVTGDEHVHRRGPDGWVYLQCPDNV